MTVLFCRQSGKWGCLKTEMNFFRACFNNKNTFNKWVQLQYLLYSRTKNKSKLLKDVLYNKKY